MAAAKSKFKLPYNALNRINEDDLNNMWLQVKEAIVQIFAENSSSLSFEELYRCVRPAILSCI